MGRITSGITRMADLSQKMDAVPCYSDLQLTAEGKIEQRWYVGIPIVGRLVRTMSRMDHAEMSIVTIIYSTVLDELIPLAKESFKSLLNRDPRHFKDLELTSHGSERLRKTCLLIKEIKKVILKIQKTTNCSPKAILEEIVLERLSELELHRALKNLRRFNICKIEDSLNLLRTIFSLTRENQKLNIARLVEVEKALNEYDRHKKGLELAGISSLKELPEKLKTQLSAAKSNSLQQLEEAYTFYQGLLLLEKEMTDQTRQSFDEFIQPMTQYVIFKELLAGNFMHALTYKVEELVKIIDKYSSTCTKSAYSILATTVTEALHNKKCTSSEELEGLLTTIKILKDINEFQDLATFLLALDNFTKAIKNKVMKEKFKIYLNSLLNRMSMDDNDKFYLMRSKAKISSIQNNEDIANCLKDIEKIKYAENKDIAVLKLMKNLPGKIRFQESLMTRMRNQVTDTDKKIMYNCYLREIIKAGRLIDEAGFSGYLFYQPSQ